MVSFTLRLLPGERTVVTPRREGRVSPIIVKWIVNDGLGKCRLHSSGSGKDPVAGLQHGSGHSDIINEREILNQMSDCQLRKNSAQWT